MGDAPIDLGPEALDILDLEPSEDVPDFFEPSPQKIVPKKAYAPKPKAAPKMPIPPPPPKFVIGNKERQEREELEQKSREAIEHLSKPLRQKSLGERFLV